MLKWGYPMRIVFVSHFYPPKYNAGTENYTAGLAAAFRAEGHEVQVVCAEDWESGRAYWNGVTHDTRDGVSVHRIHLNWTQAHDPNRVLYLSPLVDTWFDQFLAQTRPDIVHVMSAYSLGIGVLRSVRRAGIPLLLTLMDFWFLCPSIQLLRSDGHLCDGKTTAWECQACLLERSGWFRQFNHALPQAAVQAPLFGTLAHLPLITRRRGLRGMLLNMQERKRLMAEVLDLPDKVVSHSAFLRDLFAQHTGRAIDVLPLGHDLSWRGAGVTKTPSPVLRFGYIGQLHPTKGVHLLVEAFHHARLGEAARLDIWGDTSRDPAYVQSLRRLIQNHPAIQLRGRFERPTLAAVLAEIDALVVPSIWYENAPLVIHEAFAAKTPVVTSKLGGMAEAVRHEVDGLLFAHNDVTALAQALRRLCRQPGLLGQLEAGIPAVKTVDQEVGELTAIYEELVSRRAAVALPPQA